MVMVMVIVKEMAMVHIEPVKIRTAMELDCM